MLPFNILLAALIATALPKNDFEGVNLKNYYWQIADYQQPKVLVYKHKSAKEETYNYCWIKLDNGRELTMVFYDDHFNTIEYQKQVIKADSVYLEDAAFTDNHEKLMTPTHMLKGFVFAFDDYKKATGFEYWGNQMDSPHAKIEYRHTWTLDRLVQKKVDDKDSSFIVARGTGVTTITDKNTGHHTNTKDRSEFWWLKGFGLYMMKREEKGHASTDTYEKTISVEEFDKLKMAK